MKDNSIHLTAFIVVFITSLCLSATFAFASILVPGDPLFDPWNEDNPQGNNWGYEFVKFPSAWYLATSTKYTKIAVVDTGFDKLHEDLQDNITVIGPGNLKGNHGTFVAGIVGAKGNNARGIAGVMRDTSLKAQ